MNWPKKTLSERKINNDEKVIIGCINQDRKSQKLLYEKYCNAMFTTAYRITGDRDEAHDVLQEAFIQVFKDIESFKGNSTIGAWIKTITVRTALRAIKKKFLFDDIEEQEQLYSIEPDISINLDYLENAIAKLSEGYRTVFLLIEVEGYTHKETASMLGISEGTSKSQLFHAKKLLKRYLAKYSLEG